MSVWIYFDKNISASFGAHRRWWRKYRSHHCFPPCPVYQVSWLAPEYQTDHSMIKQIQSRLPLFESRQSSCHFVVWIAWWNISLLISSVPWLLYGVPLYLNCRLLVEGMLSKGEWREILHYVQEDVPGSQRWKMCRLTWHEFNAPPSCYWRPTSARIYRKARVWRIHDHLHLLVSSLSNHVPTEGLLWFSWTTSFNVWKSPSPPAAYIHM